MKLIIYMSHKHKLIHNSIHLICVILTETEFPFRRIFLYFAGTPENSTTEFIK